MASDSHAAVAAAVHLTSGCFDGNAASDSAAIGASAHLEAFLLSQYRNGHANSIARIPKKSGLSSADAPCAAYRTDHTAPKTHDGGDRGVFCGRQDASLDEPKPIATDASAAPTFSAPVGIALFCLQCARNGAGETRHA